MKPNRSIAWILTSLTLAAAPMLALASSAEGGGGDESLFAGTLAQSVAAILTFLILFALLTKFAWGPILKGLQDREAKIKGDLEQAQAASEKATATLVEYQKKLAEAQAEATKTIQASRHEAQAQAEQIRKQTQDELASMKQRAEADITAAKQQAINEIYAQAGTLAVAVAEKLLQRQINAQDQQGLIDQSIEQWRVSQAQRN